MESVPPCQCILILVFSINFGGKGIGSPDIVVMVTCGLGVDEIKDDGFIWVMAKEVPPICVNPSVENVWKLAMTEASGSSPSPNNRII